MLWYYAFLMIRYYFINDNPMDKLYDKEATNTGYKNAIVIVIQKMRTELTTFHLSFVVVENLCLVKNQFICFW